MGEVYRARDTRLDRIVAVKILPSHLSDNPDARQRFEREARAISSLSHPHICHLYDVGSQDGTDFLVMEYLDGETLAARLVKGSLPTEQVLQYGIDVADALDTAHRRGIVHRDVKPGNIFVTVHGECKVLDFGLAKLEQEVGPEAATVAIVSQQLLTSPGTAIGTVCYMSPEQARGENLDARTDIFSLGAVLYEMVTGKLAFAGKTAAMVFKAILDETPPPPTSVNPQVPAQLDQIVGKALEKDRDLRYQSVADLRTDLKRLRRETESGRNLGTNPPSQPRVANAWSPSGRKILYASVIAVVLVVLVFALRSDRVRQATLHSSVSTVAEESRLPAVMNLSMLPFETVGSDPKLVALGNGLMDTLATKLGQLGENHPLQVIPVAEMRDKHVTTLEQARQDFGVNLGLQVRLEQAADRIRVTYSLMEAKTGKALSTQTFDAPMSDPSSLEDQLSRGTAALLRLELRPEESRELASSGTTSPAAYNYYLQGRGYLQDTQKPENIQAAILLLSESLKRDAHYGFARATLGRAYWSKYELTRDKQWIDPAKNECSSAVKEGNAGAEGHVCLGFLNDGTGKYEEGVTEFQRATELEPANDQAYLGLASAYQHLNKLDQAEETYQRVVSLHPQYARGYERLGVFYLRQGQAVKGEQMMRKMVELAPDSYAAYSDLAASLMFQGRFTDALTPLQQSIAIRPTEYAYTNLGTANLRVRRYGDAAKAYRESIKLDATQYESWGSLGDAYSLAGDKASANQAYQKAIELAKQQLAVNPKNAEVLGDVAEFYNGVGDRKQALDYMQRALRYGRGDKDLMLQAAVVYNGMGETGLALEWLKKALDGGVSAKLVRDHQSFENLKDDPRMVKLLEGRTN